MSITTSAPSQNASSRLRRVLRRIGISLLTLLAFALLVALLALGVNWSVENEPIVRLSASAPASRDYVTLQSDERLFTIMAALNAAGYNDENNPDGMHPVRQAVRAALASKHIPSVDLLRIYFQAHQSMYVTWALQRNNPPDFTRQADGWWVTGMPPLLFFSLDNTLRDFYREADIATLWKKYKPEYDAEVQRYQSCATPSVQAVLDYLRVKNPPTDQVVVLPNLLDAYWRGYGPRIGDRSYVILGPSDQPNIGLIQHEAMHPIINPMIDANIQVINPAQTDRLFSRLRPLMPSAYPVWDGILKETVIRAVEVRLLSPDKREAQIAQEESQGFLLVRYLSTKLEAYEKSDVTFAEYLPTLLATLNTFDVQNLVTH